MRKSVLVVLAMVLILPALLFTVSCAKKTVQTEPSVEAQPSQPEQPAEDTSAQDDDRARQEADRIKAQELERQRAQERERNRRYESAADKFVNENVHFEFDSAVLLPEAQMVLSDKAEFLSNNGNINVTIEGHCDERGTDAYNMALGERRAEAVKTYLVNLGIAEYRFTTISYGEEKPMDPGRNEAAWSKNRRAHVTID